LKKPILRERLKKPPKGKSLGELHPDLIEE